MLERLAVLVALVALIVLGVALVRVWTARRDRRLASGDPSPFWQALGSAPDPRPSVVAFSSPSCATCHTAQAPAQQRLEAVLGEDGVRVFRVDASAQPSVAQTFGVLTVPTTVVLDARGRPVAVNHGFTPADRLASQVRAALS